MEGISPADKPLVLFVCTGNSARSIMGEAILRDLAGDRFDVHSAGLSPSRVRPETLAVLEEAGLETDGLHSKSVDEFLGKAFIHHLITVCGDAEKNCPHIWPQGGKRLHWALDDPAAVTGTDAERLDAFRRTLVEIRQRIEAWLADQPG